MFSELVDTCMGRSGRSSSFLDIVAYARSTIRDAGNSALYYKNLVEDQVIPTTDPYVWFTPTDFRKMRSVRYEIGDGIFPTLKMPGKAQFREDYYYYAASNYFTFKGMGNSFGCALPAPDTFATIDVAYYKWMMQLAYYPPGPHSQSPNGGKDVLPMNVKPAATDTRPAIYNRETETWSYLVGGVYVATTGDPNNDLIVQALVSNWLLMDWYDLCAEGTLAKLFKAINDPRASLSFQLFSKYLADLQGTGVDEALDY